REREIQAFTPEPYRIVRANFDPRYEGMWFEGDETRIFGDLSRAEQIVEKVTGKDGTVEKMEQKEQSERPPLLYDLTSLQRDANASGGAVALRGQEGDYLSANVLPVPVRGPCPAVEADRRDAPADRRVR